MILVFFPEQEWGLGTDRLLPLAHGDILVAQCWPGPYKNLPLGTLEGSGAEGVMRVVNPVQVDWVG